jgi:hypothetical protein
VNAAELIDQHVPVRDERGSWDDVVRRAGVATRRSPWARRSLVLAFAVAVLVAVGATFAVAASQGWWFLRSEGTPQPVGAVDVVKTVTWGGRQWAITAYRTDYWPSTRSLCFGVVGSETSGDGAQACADVPGELAVTFLTGSLPDGTRYVVGPVVDTAERVRITLSDGGEVDTSTFTVPAELGPIRFYATTLAANAKVERLVGLGADGQEVARLTP